ncbi:pantoate--beta-alanine ligase [Leucobacter sp. CSA2]|uniref:Pantothenate synthetase n=1 Tax=Leucobacter edaphi TaxID=2796472 RepID=A0A934QCS6_9MICO|nr:pantoate--beta-alanine ligase [Leucobacter edaphi]MBK0422276.1 pantoate--beta-alanine ligase [Leucobacter edaphi]
MRIVRTVAELRDATLAARTTGTGIALVPTMGALHEGHLSLVRAARAENALVVLSIFVNPTQFDDPSDLAAYPRTEQRDAELAGSAGADVIFAPSAAEMYPDGFATTVHVGGPLTATLEAAGRGTGHFDGVATIVSKLLLAALPDAAYFGMKDAQQVLVVRRMVRDLGIPCRIVACPTERDADGLALSSRNTRLTAEERERALAIPRVLRRVAEAIRIGAAGKAAAAAPSGDPAPTGAEPLADHGAFETARRRGLAELSAAGLDPEYLAIVDPEDLTPVDAPPAGGAVLVLAAARAGNTRLIDNVVVDTGTPVPR